MSIQSSNSDKVEASHHYRQITKAIEYLATHREQQPDLDELAAHVGMSPHHLQRVFSAWAGVSPKRFMQFLTKEHAKQMLRQHSVMDTALAAGLSGTSRLHDLMVTCEGMTPGEYQKYGQGLVIYYGVHASPFGQCLLASTDRGICKLAFFDQSDEQAVLESELHSEWASAEIIRDDNRTQSLLTTIFSNNPLDKKPLHLLLKGSPFQLKVWEALLAIPPGQLVAYNQVAEAAGSPAAVRAVSSAIARNNIGFLIPCHRVIRQSGELGGYRWGASRKQAMIGWEANMVMDES